MNTAKIKKKHSNYKEYYEKNSSSLMLKEESKCSGI